MALTRAGEGNGIYINPHVVGGIGLLITSGVLLASRSIPASVTEVLPRSATPQAGTIVAVTDDFLIDISMEAMVKRYRPNSPYKSYPSCASAIGALQTDEKPSSLRSGFLEVQNSWAVLFSSSAPCCWM